MTDIPERPAPPPDFLQDPRSYFRPAPALARWAVATFIAPRAPLPNPDHEHLLGADLACLWAAPEAKDRGRTVYATAEVPSPRGRLWGRARQEAQLHEWFGRLPDFLITVSAAFAEGAPPLAFCALMEHELYHCALATDEFGMPRFTQQGQPIFAIRGHDVEEFIPVVRRYGAAAAGPGVAALVRAAGAEPEVGPAEAAAVCGTCSLQRRAA